MTSIRQRYSHNDGTQPGHGRGEPARWPRLSEMRPLLIRSAGIVGIAGVIVGVISSGALLGDEAFETRVATAAPSQEIVGARASGSTDAAPASGQLSPELSIFASPAGGAGLQAFAPADAAVPAIVPAAAIAGAGTEPEPAQPPAVATPPAASVVETVMEERFGGADVLPAAEGSMAAGAEVLPRDPAPGIAADASVVVEAEGDTDIDIAWADDSLACPAEPAAAADAPPQSPTTPACRTLAALAPADSSPADLEALSEAAAEHAEELALLGPRVPKRRPDPPKRARYRTAPGGALPAPPECGSKHAYWHYVDRKRSVREWYCR